MPPFRQCDGVVDPFEKKTAQLILQLLDLEGDGGLGVAQLLGGFRKTAQFRHVDKGEKIP
jgi:hypothetical protein